MTAAPPLPRRAAMKVAASAIAAAMAGREVRAQAPAPAAATPEAPVFGAVLAKLPNGLTVVTLESRRAPVASQMMWYRVGSADEPPGLSGMAHFLEHLMFRGTPSVPSGQFSRRVARVGGNDNAFTSFDYTAYHQQVARESLPLVMAMEADRMQALLLDPATLETERGVILEERRQVVDNVPRSRFREQLNATLYVNHPYSHPVIGWEHEIRTLPRAEIKEFHDRHYAPDNAILILSGAVTPAEAMELAAEHYGKIPSKGVAPRIRPQEPPPVAERRLSLRDARATEPQVTRAWLAPSYVSAGPFENGIRHALPLEVAAQILASGPGSRLYAALVESGLATNAGAWITGESVDATDFGIAATCRRGVETAKLEAALDAALARFLEDGAGEAETARAIRQMTEGAIFARDSLMGGARVVGAALATGVPLEEVEAWPARIRAVTPAQVTEAARTILGKPSVTGWLMPQAAA
jgi:zinc protease